MYHVMQDETETASAFVRSRVIKKDDEIWLETQKAHSHSDE